MRFLKLVQRSSQLQVVRQSLVPSLLVANEQLHQRFYGIHVEQSKELHNATIHNVTLGSDYKLVNKVHINHVVKRFKRKRPRNDVEETAEESDSDDDDLANENPLLVDDLLGSQDDGSQELTIDIGSLRLDAFVKTALNMTRANVEEQFYKGNIFLNGALPTKKSQDVSKNDEVDVIRGTNTENNKLVDVRRVFIVDMPDKATEHGRMKLKIKRWMNLTVEPPGRKDDD